MNDKGGSEYLRAVRWRRRVAGEGLEESLEPRVVHGTDGGVRLDHQRDAELLHQALDVCERHVGQGSADSFGRIGASKCLRELV